MWVFVDWYLRIGLGEALLIILLSSPKTKWQWFRHIILWFPIIMKGVVGKGKW